MCRLWAPQPNGCLMRALVGLGAGDAELSVAFVRRFKGWYSAWR